MNTRRLAPLVVLTALSASVAFGQSSSSTQAGATTQPSEATKLSQPTSGPAAPAAATPTGTGPTLQPTETPKAVVLPPDPVAVQPAPPAGPGVSNIEGAAINSGSTLNRAGQDIPIVQPANTLNRAGQNIPVMQVGDNPAFGVSNVPVIQPANTLNRAGQNVPLITAGDAVTGPIGTNTSGAMSSQLTMAGGGTLVAQPGSNGTVVSQLSDGQVVVALEQQGDFVRVQTADGQTGFVRASADGMRASPVVPTVSRVDVGSTLAAPGRVELRGNPADGGPVTADVSAATELTILATSGDFVQVRTASGDEGWARAEAVVMPRTPAAVGSDFVLGDNIDLAGDPSADAIIVERAEVGSHVEILEVEGEWAHVKTHAGAMGWVKLDDLSALPSGE